MIIKYIIFFQKNFFLLSNFSKCFFQTKQIPVYLQVLIIKCISLQRIKNKKKLKNTYSFKRMTSNKIEAVFIKMEWLMNTQNPNILTLQLAWRRLSRHAFRMLLWSIFVSGMYDAELFKICSGKSSNIIIFFTSLLNKDS